MEKTMLQITVEAWADRLLERVIADRPAQVEHTGEYDTPNGKAIWLTTHDHIINISVESKHKLSESEEEQGDVS